VQSFQDRPERRARRYCRVAANGRNRASGGPPSCHE
jgi:hypothetical protein